MTTVNPALRVMRFGGKDYFYFTFQQTKAEATRVVRSQRRQGFNARIAPLVSGYGIYRRPKESLVPQGANSHKLTRGSRIMKANPMKLMTKAIAAKIPPLYSQENNPDPTVWVKFFTPDSNWTWYGIEWDGKDIFFGWVVGFDMELGNFSLSELKKVRGSLGLPIERDLYFRPRPLSEVKKFHSPSEVGFNPRKSISKKRMNPNNTAARKYRRLYQGDLKAGHKDAANFWQGAASAEFTSNPVTPKRKVTAHWHFELKTSRAKEGLPAEFSRMTWHEIPEQHSHAGGLWDHGHGSGYRSFGRTKQALINNYFG